MKFNQFLLKTLLTVCLVFAGGGANAATTINLGGYVPTADSPVVGGFVPFSANTSYTGTSYGVPPCSPSGSFTSYSSGFGLIGSDGFVMSYISCGSPANRYKATCPNNTVAMSITGYIRPDNGAAFTGILCIKTDTY